MNVKVLGISLLLLALWIVMAIAAPESFLSANNFENLLRLTALYGILGIGVAFVIISSGIDLSIGSLVAFSAAMLAVLLAVTYAPFDAAAVARVDGARRVVLIHGSGDAFKPGDRIRYYGGRRAPNAQLTVVSVSPAESPEGGTGTFAAVAVDAAIAGNDTYGTLAHVVAVRAFSRATADTPASVTLAGEHPHIAPRDQVTLASPDETQILQLTVTDAAIDAGDTRLTLNDDPGDTFSDRWVAVPVERRQRASIPAALAIVLALGVGLGIVHGLLVTRVRLQPFVVTLCGLLIYRGLARWLTGDTVVGFGNEYQNSLSWLATGKIGFSSDPNAFGIPNPFVILVVVAVAAAVVLNKTVWGRYLLALGRNEEAARYSGINTGRVIIGAYVVCGLLTAVGGVLFALQYASVSPSSFGTFFELWAIAAAVLGGCSLRGGEGSILGVVIGTAVMQTLNNIIVLMHISDTLEYVIIGAVILAGVTADEMLHRLAARRRAAQKAAA